MSTHPPELSLVIPTNRPGRSLSRLLASIYRQQNPPRFEVLVVANPPSPSLRRMLERRFAEATYVETECEGANHARNAGVERSLGQVVLFLDDDCELDDRSFLREHFEAHLRRPETAAIGGPYRSKKSVLDLIRPAARAYRALQNRWLLAGSEGGDTRFLMGGNFSIKGPVIRENRFDPELVFGGTETELFLRLRARGLHLTFLPQLSLLHDSRPSLRTLIRKSFWQGIGSGYIKKKHISANHHFEPRDRTRGWIETLFSVGFTAGERYFGETGHLTVTRPVCRRLIFREALRRVRAVPFNRFFTEAYCCIAAALEREEARKKGSQNKIGP